MFRGVPEPGMSFSALTPLPGLAVRLLRPYCNAYVWASGPWQAGDGW